MSEMPPRQGTAAQLIEALRSRRLTIAAAESLTGGLVGAALTSVPGASACVQGAVVSYATDLKADLLGVDPDLLLRSGPVDAEVARQMAHGVARMCRSSIGVATTGVAGPEPQGGAPVGTAFISVHDGRTGQDTTEQLALVGSREEIRAQVVDRLLALALRLVTDDTEPGSPPVSAG